jgi:DNA mismatch repair ATPase MutS
LLGTRIVEAIMRILTAERNAFESLRREVNIEAGALRRNARIMDELDVTLGFANLASEMKFVRPILNER